MSLQTADSQGHSTSQPADEAALLITCLRGLPFDVPHDTDWRELLCLAEENGVLLLLHQELLGKGVEMPAGFTAGAQERRNHSEKVAAELERHLQQFAEHGIEVIPLKGPVLASALYGDAALRSCNDLDLLVRPDEYDRARTLLLDCGLIARDADDYHCRYLGGVVPVELHFSIAKPMYFPFNLEGIWSRSRTGYFRGQPIRTMSDEDLILYLCSHGLKHGFSRLVWILDVAMALRGLRDCSYEELTRTARKQDQEPWLLIGCEVIRTMFPQHLPPAMAAVIAASPAAAKRARNAAARLFAEDPKDVVNDYRGLYLQASPNLFKRLRYRLRYLAPTTEDCKWAESHSINRRFMIVLRPVRLLQKYGASIVWRVLFPPKT